MESGAESQSSGVTQPIQEIEIDGDDGLKIVAGPADGGEAELGNGADAVKKKRGRPPRVQAKPPAKINKEEDEDVCFICFDGGSLVLCDRRGCPKAYHPACVKRDEEFFRSTAKWNCGWHICSICQKAARHMCYTCTYSLCKGCIKKADYVSVRGDKGFCSVCTKTIMLIENGGQEKDEKAQVDFDDKTSWEYLFKVYWVYLKGKLSLTLDELTQAKNPRKEASTTASVTPLTCVHNGVDGQKNISSDKSPQNLEAGESKRRKTDEAVNIPQKETVVTKKAGTDERSSVIACKDWATKELLDFISHMKSGDTSVLSQFDVQELMLEYIKRNNLRDPRKKSQIICDSRLKILFGKPRVGHFEMLKLLEFHFLINEDLSKKKIKSISRQVDPDWNIDNMVAVGKDKKRRNHRKVEEQAPQNKLDEYAAIDVHNMNLIYLRRKLMEDLIENVEEFHGKVVGSIVRIRISKKQDMYRLVQVVGTSKADAPYKIGNKAADVVLEVLNLDKKETVSIDTVSNQDLSEDECRRLRQSIRCGLVKRFTVREIQDKAVSLQPARLNDLMEAETLRLNNLRDRASEKGHKKSLREYVEKLQLLKTPEERERRLREILEVHSDPKMNLDYETDDTEEHFNKEHGEHKKPNYSGISRKSSSPFKKGKDFSNNVGSMSWKNEAGSTSTKAMERVNMKKDAHRSSSSGRSQSQVDYNSSTITNQNNNSPSEASTSSYSVKNTSISNDSELDKVWHYRDPSGKIQGPFCMVQLQKWSTTGFFPQDMRIWRNREDDSLLLNDVLNDKTATEKVSIRIKGLTVRTTNLSPTQNSVQKLSDTHGSTSRSSVQKWIGNGGNTNTPSFGESNESTVTDLASPTPAVKENGAAMKPISSVFDIANADLVDLPSPTPKEAEATHEDEKVQNAVDKEAGNVEAQLPETGEVKCEESHLEGGHIVTTSANMEQVIPPSSPSQPSSQPGYNYLPPGEGVRETIEFSILGEESVSDLLAEVDAMESQNGFPSPTSTRNTSVEDLFDGTFEDFSPTPVQGARSDTFSSDGTGMHLPFQPTTTTTTTTVETSQGNNTNAFDFAKSSSDLQFKSPEIPQETTYKAKIDVNNPTKAESAGRETKASEMSHDRAGGSAECNEGEHTEPTTTKVLSSELVLQVRTEHKEAADGTLQSTKVDAAGPSPPPQSSQDHREAGNGTLQSVKDELAGAPPALRPQPQSSQPLLQSVSLAIGLDKVYSQGNLNNFGRPAQEIMTRGMTIGRDIHQRTYVGDRFNHHSPMERSYKAEDLGYSRDGKPWVRQSSFGSYPKAPPKGQRVCKFYESGRCKKGASCNYWHP